MNKKIAVALTIMTAAVVSLTAVSYASEWRGPADTLAAIAGKTVEAVEEEKDSGVGYGAQAAELDLLDEFKAARTEAMTARLEQAVEDERITQAEADARLQEISERMSECEGVPGECEPANGSRGLKLGDGEGTRLQDGSGGQQRGGMNGGGLGQGRGRAGK